MLYIMRMILLTFLYIISGTLGVILGILRPFNPSNVYPVATLITQLGRKILGFNIIIEGKDIIAKTHPCIVISNHQENMDTVTCSAVLEPRVVSLGKKSLKWIPIFGQFYWLSGNILIDRSNRKRAMNSMKLVAKAINENDTSLWIMPEGTRSKGRGVLPFKKGAFYTAINAQVDIVPVCISSYGKALNLNKWNSGTIRIRILEPISVKGLTKDDVHGLTQKAHGLVKRNVEELDSLA